MGQIKLFNNFLRNISTIKWRTLLCFIAMFIIIVLENRNFIYGAPKNIKLSAFDILCSPAFGTGLTGSLALIFPIIPFFIFILINLVDFENRTFYLVRSSSRIYIWNKKIVFSIILALIFSLSLVFGGYLISGFIIGDFHNNWSSSDSLVFNMIGHTDNWMTTSKMFVSYKILFCVFTSNFLGLCTIGFLACTLKTVLKNVYVYLTLILILFSDSMLTQFSLIVKQMTLNINNWISPSTIVFNDGYLILLLFFLYVVGKKLTANKDFIEKN